MAQVHLFKHSLGWRAAVEKWGHLFPVEGIFQDRLEAIRRALATSRQIQL